MQRQTDPSNASCGAKTFSLCRFLLASGFLISASSILMLGMIVTTVERKPIYEVARLPSQFAPGANISTAPILPIALMELTPTKSINAL